MKEIFADLSIKYEKTRSSFDILRTITQKQSDGIPSTFRTLIDRNIDI